MSFPISPTNGQQTTVNGITYTYSTSTTAWRRVAGNLAFTVQAAGSYIGTATILNFATGTTAAVSGGVVTIQATAASISPFTGIFTITNTTTSISTTTGALQVAGGVGIGGGLFVGGNITATNLTLNTSTIALGNSSSAVQGSVAIGFGATANISAGVALGVNAKASGNSIAIGQTAGYVSQGIYSVAIGDGAARSQGNYSVAIGSDAGRTAQSDYAVAIGYSAGSTSQVAGSIVISATSTNAITTVSNQGLYITPIRADATTSATTYGIYYNPVTNELTTSTAASGSSTGTTSTFLISNTTASTSTNTGALQVAGGVGVGGSLYVGGAVTATNYVTIINSTTNTARGVEAIIGNSDGTFLSPNNASVMLHVTGQVNQPGRVYIDGQGSGAYSAVIGRRYNGTTAAPTGLATNDVIFRLGSTPYTTGGFPSISTTRIDYLANETQTTSSYGTRIEFWATPNSSTSIVKTMSMSSTGTAILSTASSTSTTTGALTVTGGVGIGGDLYVGGNIVANQLTIQLTTITTTLVQTDDIIQTLNTTASTGTTTGALIVAGGVGVGGGMYVGGTVTATQVNITSANIQLGSGAGVGQGGAAISIGNNAGIGQGYNAIAIGQQAGGLSAQNPQTIAIGSGAGAYNQGTYAIAIGGNSGGRQGAYSIALGYQAGITSQTTGSIIINATSTNVIATATNQGLYITPIRADATSSATTYAMYYNAVTREVTTSTPSAPVTTLPLQLNDVSNQTNGSKSVFALKVDQDAVTGLTDSKNLEVVVDGRRLAAYVAEQRYPWITPYDSYKGFRVVSTGTTAQYLVIYNAPSIGSEVIITQLNTSASKQTRKYPYSAASIALGD